jgi:hypothetical protein
MSIAGTTWINAIRTGDPSDTPWVPQGLYDLSSSDQSISISKVNRYVYDISVSATSSNPNSYLMGVSHDDTLLGNGTPGAPLGISGPVVHSLTAGQNVEIVGLDGNYIISATAGGGGAAGPQYWHLAGQDLDTLAPTAGPKYVEIPTLVTTRAFTMPAPDEGTTTIEYICDDATLLSSPLDNTLPTAECMKGWVSSQITASSLWVQVNEKMSPTAADTTVGATNLYAANKLLIGDQTRGLEGIQVAGELDDDDDKALTSAAVVEYVSGQIAAIPLANCATQTELNTSRTSTTRPRLS